jgi:ribosomal protein S18 acetylase RimI-like enzyme
MGITTIEPYRDAEHRSEVIALWETVFGYVAKHNNPSLAIDKKRDFDDLFFVAMDAGAVVGTVMGGYDGHRGWIYALAVAPSHRRQGIGSRLVAHAEDALSRKGCMKINLQILEENASVAAFYLSLGYSVENRINMGKVLPENIPSTG